MPWILHFVGMIIPCQRSESCSKKTVLRNGRFYRRSESRWIQRYKCRSCGSQFSAATGTLEFKQKKRRVNMPLFLNLSSGMSMRRCARVLRIDRRTVDRKLVYLAKKAKLAQQEFLASIRGTVANLEFDDLITNEHTKMKPLTVSLAVDADRRFILGAVVGKIPASGLLAEKSRRKYGLREYELPRTLHELFKMITPTISKTATIRSDMHKAYAEVVKRFLPGLRYDQFEGGRAAIAGQGELKRKRFDPLFCLNHTCAMLRANINRLIRKTWCVTKRPDRLQMHIDIFTHFYNLTYLQK